MSPSTRTSRSAFPFRKRGGDDDEDDSKRRGETEKSEERVASPSPARRASLLGPSRIALDPSLPPFPGNRSSDERVADASHDLVPVSDALEIGRSLAEKENRDAWKWYAGALEALMRQETPDSKLKAKAEDLIFQFAASPSRFRTQSDRKSSSLFFFSSSSLILHSHETFVDFSDSIRGLWHDL